MNELVRVETREIGNELKQTVDARELHEFLGVGRKFNGWIRGRLSEYDFQENMDFIKIINSNVEGAHMGPQYIRSEYLLSLDVAKELSMVERTDKGKQVRRYFISIEKKFRKSQGFNHFPSPVEMVPLAAEKIYPALFNFAGMIGLTGNQQILSAIQGVNKVSGVNLLELVGHAHLLADTQERHFTPTELGERIGLSAIKFNRRLVEVGLQSKVNDAWTPTDVGKKYAVLLDTTKKHKSGAPIQQLKWLESVMEFFNEGALQ